MASIDENNNATGASTDEINNATRASTATKKSGKGKRPAPRFLPKNTRTPIGQRKERARRWNRNVPRAATREKMAEAYFEKFGQMKIAEPDIADALSRLALVEDINPRGAKGYAPFRLLGVLSKAGMIYHTYGRNRKQRLLSDR